MGPSCGSFWRVVGPPRALVGLRLGSFSVSFGALVAFGVRVLRDVVDFSCHGGQVEAFRGVSEASGGHFGGQKPSNTIGKPMFFVGFWKTTFSITRVVQIPS